MGNLDNIDNKENNLDGEVIKGKENSLVKKYKKLIELGKGKKAKKGKGKKEKEKKKKEKDKVKKKKKKEKERKKEKKEKEREKKKKEKEKKKKEEVKKKKKKEEKKKRRRRRRKNRGEKRINLNKFWYSSTKVVLILIGHRDPKIILKNTKEIIKGFLKDLGKYKYLVESILEMLKGRLNKLYIEIEIDIKIGKKRRT